jgi:5-methylcytosine-specific restriction endonuclease McrA
MPVSKQFLDKLAAALDLLLAPQAERRAEAKHPRIHPRPSRTNHTPTAVRRSAWSRDDGKCTGPLDSGGIYGSTLRLEVDHVVPRARGGPSTIDN